MSKLVETRDNQQCQDCSMTVRRRIEKGKKFGANDEIIYDLLLPKRDRINVKLHRVLTDRLHNGMLHFDENAITIQDVEAFVANILPECFGNVSFPGFRNNLRSYSLHSLDDHSTMQSENVNNVVDMIALKHGELHRPDVRHLNAKKHDGVSCSFYDFFLMNTCHLAT